MLRKFTFAYVALMALLALTVAGSFVPMGPGNLALGLGISAAKTAIIAAIFMRLLESKALRRLAAASAVLWLGFLFVLTFVDYASR